MGAGLIPCFLVVLHHRQHVNRDYGLVEDGVIDKVKRVSVPSLMSVEKPAPNERRLTLLEQDVLEAAQL